VLGVDRIVLDRGIEPQSVALLAVIEGPLEWPGVASPASAAPATTAPPFGPTLGVLILIGAIAVLGRLGAGALGLGFGGFELRGDQRVILGAEVDLLGVVANGRIGTGLLAGEVVLALELLDVADTDLQLVCHPGVGPSLAHPGADLIEVRTQ
jgi:hypothetical protein